MHIVYVYQADMFSVCCLVAMYVFCHRFEQRTTEAAKLKLDVDKAIETIRAAENLIGKLEGEYKRWSTQVL